jgi:hypothetical protein
MFRVEPEGVETAMLAHDLDDLGMEKLAYAEHPDELAIGEEFLDLGHDLMTWLEISEEAVKALNQQL